MLSKVATWLLSPSGTAFSMAALAMLMAWRHRLRSCLAMMAVAFVWVTAWSTPVLSHWLCAGVEQQYPEAPIADIPKAQAMVVLGGGMAPPSGGNIEIGLGSEADHRVWFGARLYHSGKAPLLLLSGGNDPQSYAFSEARAMAAFLTDLGVPVQAMVLEEQSRNTRQNAAFSAAILKARGIERILLVTSAMHMPRAVALFSAQGLQVVPAPTDFEASQAARSGLLAWMPDALALDASGRAIKEIVGRWVGW